MEADTTGMMMWKGSSTAHLGRGTRQAGRGQERTWWAHGAVRLHDSESPLVASRRTGAKHTRYHVAKASYLQ